MLQEQKKKKKAPLDEAAAEYVTVEKPDIQETLQKMDLAQKPAPPRGCCFLR